MPNVLSVTRVVIVLHAILDSLYFLTLVILVRITANNALILLLVLNAQTDSKTKEVRVYARQDTI